MKPDFFRHELLQEMESRHPVHHPMLVFAGLWGHCDKAGRFLWRPKHLKLDILPFLPFDMAETLALLEAEWLVVRYQVGAETYGWIPTFNTHQAIGGKEAQGTEKYPEPNGEVIEKYREATGKHPRLQEGKGREGNKEGNGAGSAAAVDKSRSTPNGQWWATQEATLAKAIDLGIPTRGETWEGLKRLIRARQQEQPTA